MAIFSFYKLVPSYVGGGLRINNKEFVCQMLWRDIGISRSLVVLKRLLEQLISNFDRNLLKTAFLYLEEKRVALKKAKIPSLGRDSAAIGETYHFDEDLASARMPWFARMVLQLNDLETT